VDDETSFLDTVRALFTAWSKNGWHIESATSADQALEILKTRKFDLIVVDVNMPVLDGIQFLRIVNRRFPDLKKAAITGHASEEKRSACLANGAELFIEKPRSADGLKSIFAMLDELLTWRQQAGFRGMLRQVGLPYVIQMECLGRNSSILEVQDRQMTGRIYIEDGRIIHADAGEMKGEPAFQKLLSLPGGSFQLQHFEPPTERTIEGQWEFLLMEAARVHDETAGKTPAAEPAPEPPPEPPPASQSSTTGSALSVRVAETLICGGQGKLLYEWQCADANARVALLMEIGQQASRAGRLLPLGKFDRLEIQLPTSRAVAQVKPNRMVFVHVVTEGGPS
jgi:CheY-like chemotaxis protein